ncbi:MAG: YraN family protein, partial [Ilumatobacteraceae bacterium]
VGPDKQRRLRRAAEEWIQVRRPDVDSFRFDVVAITGVAVERYEAAF